MNTTKYCGCCHTEEGGKIYICPACDEDLLWDHCRGGLSGKALTITNSGMHFSLFPVCIISGSQIFQYNTFFVEAYIKNRDVNMKKNEAHLNKGKTPRTVHSIKRSSSINKEVKLIFIFAKYLCHIFSSLLA